MLSKKALVSANFWMKVNADSRRHAKPLSRAQFLLFTLFLLLMQGLIKSGTIFAA